MGKAVSLAVLQPAAVTVSLLIIVQQLATFPLKAVAILPEYSSDKLLLPRDDPVTGGYLHRSQFPKDFIFGTGTSAFQVEGAASLDGKGESIWDTWCHSPGNRCNGDNFGDAVDEYHRYEEDLDLVAAMNMDTYRFSIAWTRIFPNGTGPQVNKEGVAYYNRLIDAAVSRGIKPMVTLFHWDLPQALQDKYTGWINHQIVYDFTAYAETCFANFGDRVKYWTTFNEPQQFVMGFGTDEETPPGLSRAYSGTQPYMAAHNVLLAHAAAVDVYRRQFQAKQDGVIGMTVDCKWGEPLTNSTADVEAAERKNLFQLGWFLDPIYFGKYPEVMRQNVGNRLPTFSEDEVLQLKGSLDFIGLNHYTSRWITDGPGPLPNQESDWILDCRVTDLHFKDGVAIGPLAASDWLRIVPWGLYKILKWTSARYNAPIIVTENGMDYNDDVPLEDSLHDSGRIQFFQDYMSSILRATREGVDVRGYVVWSLLDNVEWKKGYSLRFGVIYVDYKDGMKRYLKDSARWFAQILDRTRSNS